MTTETQLSVTIYDTTLRDGGQDPRTRLSVEKKLAIAQRLNVFRIPYIEGGWPGANPMDTEFFKEARGSLSTSELVAFGMTARIGVRPDNDDLVNGLLESGAKTLTIFGKSWEQHVGRVFTTPTLKNLDTIHDTVRYLVSKGRRVFFDAEHFFDGFAQNSQYALAALEAAQTGGAECLILCDTRGSKTPAFIYKATRAAKRAFSNTELGIHVHNDRGEAVTSTIYAVKAGATQVQGTLGDLGERSGNLDLSVFLPTARESYNIDSGLDLRGLFGHTHYLAGRIEISVSPNTPWVGEQAFTHRAGAHINSMEKDQESYEHADPGLVGNQRHYINSEQGGSTNIEVMARKHGFEISRNDPSFKLILDDMKLAAVLGDAQEYLLLHKYLGDGNEPFIVVGRRIVDDSELPPPHARIGVRVNGNSYSEEAEGDGPINAFDLALKKVLSQMYPQVNDVSLTDYHVTLPRRGGGTAAEVEAFVEFGTANGDVWNSRVRGTDQQRAGEDAIIDGYKYWILSNY